MKATRASMWGLCVLGCVAVASCGGAPRRTEAPDAKTDGAHADEPSTSGTIGPREARPAATEDTLAPSTDGPTPAIEPSDPGAASPRTAPPSPPTEPTPLEGPFASLDDYLRANPPGHDPSCGPLQKPTAPPKRMGGRGRIADARLIRLPDSFACGAMEYCLLALRTRDGWFVRRSERPCQGVVGPSQEVSLPELRSRWVGGADAPVLAIEETRTRASMEVSTRGGVKDERTHEHESRYLVLCGAGPSGVPSCTEHVVVSCPRFDGTTSEVTWALRGDALELSSAADPADACDMDDPFVVGTFPLTFP